MKVISSPICPFVQRVNAVLEAKDVTYEVEYIDLMNLPAWFIKISPNAEVPILITDDNVPLFESFAICEYLEEMYSPALHPDDPEKKALGRAWARQAVTQYLVQCSTQRPASKEILEEKTENFVQLFTKVEKVLRDGPFFDGEKLSMVDTAWIPILHSRALIKKFTGFDFLDGYPKVIRWQQALLQTDALKNSVPGMFEEYFIQFYLNDEHYLGRL
ncbi:MAG: glutathione S-transferase family protein, partial [Methylococcales bacterium]|nr:glutathione S-transferase family protein [Methylococcales bacterium]